MSVPKPSKNENEYFVLHDAELIKAAHQHAEAERAAAERRSHFMKCPKDGFDLVAQDFHGVPIETCAHCGGVWLDASDVHAFSHWHEPNVVSRIFAEFLASLHFANQPTHT
jgi:uncharacterized protein